MVTETQTCDCEYCMRKYERGNWEAEVERRLGVLEGREEAGERGVGLSDAMGERYGQVGWKEQGARDR